MQCDICAKKKATVHLTEIVDDQMTELHLCEDCAREKSVQMEQQFGLADLLAGLADFGKPAKSVDQVKLTCPACGLTYDDFRKLGRLGCGQCYTAFKENLYSLLKRIHGSSQHLGKVPLNIPRPAEGIGEKKVAVQEIEDIHTLKELLHQAVASEDFEQAARLRDKIRSIEQKKDKA